MIKRLSWVRTTQPCFTTAERQEIESEITLARAKTCCDPLRMVIPMHDNG
jgi:hypothetical protein